MDDLFFDLWRDEHCRKTGALEREPEAEEAANFESSDQCWLISQL